MINIRYILGDMCLKLRRIIREIKDKIKRFRRVGNSVSEDGKRPLMEEPVITADAILVPPDLPLDLDSLDNLWNRGRRVVLKAFKEKYDDCVTHYTNLLDNITDAVTRIHVIYILSNICLWLKFYDHIEKLSRMYFYTIDTKDRVHLL